MLHQPLPGEAAPRVEFFIGLACQDRCWNVDRLARHGLPQSPCCVLCNQARETMGHILTSYSFSCTCGMKCSPGSNYLAALPWPGIPLLWTSGDTPPSPPPLPAATRKVGFSLIMLTMQHSQIQPCTAPHLYPSRHGSGQGLSMDQGGSGRACGNP